MNILLIGSSGFIGTYIKKQLIKNYDVDCPSSLELDITNEEHLKNFLKNKHYDFIILAAACKDINKLQNNEDYAYKINTEPLNNFIKHIKKEKLLFISTDYVFDEKKGNNKDIDKTCANTVYGKTKEKAEQILINSDINYTIIRTSAVMGIGSNFFDWLITSLKNNASLDIFSDSYFTPTPIELLCETIQKIIDTPIDTKIIHACGDERLSRYEFALMIQEILKTNCKINPIQKTYKDYSIVQSEYTKSTQKTTLKKYMEKILKNV